MSQRVTGFIGKSGSGKTTLIEALVRRAVARGLRVAAIKHTHHTPEPARRGDTDRLTAAGAAPVILCNDEAAIRFTGTDAIALADPNPEVLLRAIDAEVVFVEGFKRQGEWPRLLVIADNVRSDYAIEEQTPDLRHVVAVVSDAAAASAVLPRLPHFARSDIETIEAFVDRISGP
jgi:molybdopterin-guanine dinucleotide biosynthesis protein B